MDKKRLTKVLVRADKSEVAALTAEIQKTHIPIIVKEPCKTLTMVKLRDPVKRGMFFIGEVIICEAAVEIDGVQGVSVLMEDDMEKVLDMAIIDAAVNNGVFNDFERLAELEEKQNKSEMQEHVMDLRTPGNFESINQEAPDELAANKKA